MSLGKSGLFHRVTTTRYVIGLSCEDIRPLQLLVGATAPRVHHEVCQASRLDTMSKQRRWRPKGIIRLAQQIELNERGGRGFELGVNAKGVDRSAGRLDSFGSVVRESSAPTITGVCDSNGRPRARRLLLDSIRSLVPRPFARLQPGA